MRKTFLAFACTLFLAGCFWHTEGEYLDKLDQSVSSDETQVEFTVEPGMSTRSIAAKLQSAGLISDAWVLEWYADRNGLNGKLQAGTYRLSPALTVSEIAEKLKTAYKDTIRVTIPEGYRLTQIDSTFAQAGLTQPGEILSAALTHLDLPLLNSLPNGVDLEGYLFPDTYDFEADATAAEIVTKLVDAMDTKFTSDLRSAAAAQGRTLHEVLTVASLVERESFTDAERPLIADIIWRRLDTGMSLGIDATVQYAVADDWKQALTYDDLQTDSPYNTRKYAGLPPGPICSPSLSSLRAAVSPEANDYWYYLHDADGVVHFATTNDEQNANRARYLK